MCRKCEEEARRNNERRVETRESFGDVIGGVLNAIFPVGYSQDQDVNRSSGDHSDDWGAGWSHRGVD